MDAALEKMETQLKLWSLKIDKLAARTQAAGVRAGFDAHTRIDELKALLAIAQSRLLEYKAAGGTERARLKAGFKSAWMELDTAFRQPKP
jgi:hypothetical protein